MVSYLHYLTLELTNYPLSIALLLCAPVELLLDQGIIAIVPVPGAMTTPTTWICVVLDDTDVERDVCAYDKTYKLKVSFPHRVIRYLLINY